MIDSSTRRVLGENSYKKSLKYTSEKIVGKWIKLLERRDTVSSDRMKNTKRNVITGFLSIILDMLFPFILNTIVIRTLGVEYLGLNSLFASILQVLSLAELGVGAALVFSMYDPIAKGETFKVCALLRLYRNVYLSIGSVIVFAGAICIPFLDKFIQGDVPDNLNIYILFIINLANTAVSYFLFSYRTSLLQASQRIDIRNEIGMITSILMNVSKILILVLLRNYYLFCLSVPFFTIINNIIIWYITRKKFPEYRCRGTISKEEQREIRKRIFGLFINRVCEVICNSFDSIVISSFLGLTILGKYNNYYYIMNALMTVLGIIIYSMIPSIGNSIATETKEKNYNDFLIIQYGFSWLTGCACICLVCLYQPFIELWVGKDMLMDTKMIFLFGLYMYLVKSSEVFTAFRQAAGIWAKDKIRPILEAGINLILNVFLVKNFGVFGVLVSTIVTLGLIHIVWGSYYLFKEYFTEYSHIKYLFHLLYYFVLTVIGTITCYFICGLFDLSGIPCILVRLGICLLVSNIIYFSGLSWKAEFKKIIGLIRNMNKRR